jgi:ribosome biogenesis GTPase
MVGKIVKGIAGFYYVDVEGEGVYQCRAKGIFRNKKIKPLIGDNVVIEVTHEADMEGNVTEILPRTNALVRPTVSNVDQAFVVFALSHPTPNLNLLDRFLVAVEMNHIDAVICFNKADLMTDEETKEIVDIYLKAGYDVLPVSATEAINTHLLDQYMEGKTTVFAGPSGVGKSTLVNLLQNNTYMETGQVSEKIKRGKHTTRHANLILMKPGTYLVDTPGFSSLDLNTLEENELKAYFREFEHFEPYCKFNGCNHLNEPKCGVKEAVASNEISESRYTSYKQIYDELKDIRRY